MLEPEVWRDGKRIENLKVAQIDWDRDEHVDQPLRRIHIATCPGAHCNCEGCRDMRRRAEMAAKAPLGKSFGKGLRYVAVVLATQKQIKVVGLFTTITSALAYVKANWKTEPLGKTRFTTREGHVIIVQQYVNVLTMEES